VLDIDGTETNIAFDAIEKARIVPDLVALGLAPKTPRRAGKARKS